MCHRFAKEFSLVAFIKTLGLFLVEVSGNSDFKLAEVPSTDNTVL